MYCDLGLEIKRHKMNFLVIFVDVRLMFVAKADKVYVLDLKTVANNKQISAKPGLGIRLQLSLE